MQTALSIAGSDSSAGAGIQADLKTFHAHGVYGLTAITAVTVQNTQKVYSVQEIRPEIVRDQIICLFEDFKIGSLKMGMVFNKEIIKAIAEALDQVQAQKIVLDPVMISKSGYSLLQSEAREALQNELLPRADLITPNIPEAEEILNLRIGSRVDLQDAAEKLLSFGAKRVILKGGHLKSESGRALDLYYDGETLLDLDGPFIQTKSTHGTGCTFSAAITANLALGLEYAQAAQKAKDYITSAILKAEPLGHGNGPTNHFWEFSSGDINV